MRARSRKPGFFKNEDLAEVGPYAQLLFERLWCLADREGKLGDRPKKIKAEIFPCCEPGPETDTSFANCSDAHYLNRYREIPAC